LISLENVGPMMHVPPTGVSLGVVLARSSPGLASRMSALATQIDPGLTTTATPLSESVRETLAAARGVAIMASGLGVVAVLLAIVGVFSVFSYLVEERRREIGIRLALGATKPQVRLALAAACRWPVAGGLAGGLVLSLAAGSLLRGYLFGLSPIDPSSYGIVTLVLLAAAIAATAIPVRRALRVDPAVTLRAE
jgi:ABC-type antimicrobial peptide transport system permease subunit